MTKAHVSPVTRVSLCSTPSMNVFVVILNNVYSLSPLDAQQVGVFRRGPVRPVHHLPERVPHPQERLGRRQHQHRPGDLQLAQHRTGCQEDWLRYR